MYTQIIIKKISSHIYKKLFFVLQNIRMINLSSDELKLIAQSRNISNYENKSQKDLVKALRKPKPKPKIKIRINKKKLEEIKKDFNELRHKFSKKEIDKYRKTFYDIKNYKHLSESEIVVVRENLNKLKKKFKV